MKNKFHLISFLIFIMISVFSGCNKKSAENIVFDNSYPLALAPDVEWAVVTEPYAVYKETNDWGAATTGHVRKGEILQIKGKAVDSKMENWYYFEGGWLSQTSISVFNNRYKAESVSKTLLSNE